MSIALLASLALSLAGWQAMTTRSAPAAPIASSRSLDGRSVVDGDTFRLAGKSIRLHGVDAPELAQTCEGWAAGEAARHTLVALVAGRAPQCESVAKDVYGRTVAICRVNGKDVGEAMVSAGMAYAVNSERYRLQEKQAKLNGLGIHARRCASPADWRASHPK